MNRRGFTRMNSGGAYRCVASFKRRRRIEEGLARARNRRLRALLWLVAKLTIGALLVGTIMAALGVLLCRWLFT